MYSPENPDCGFNWADTKPLSICWTSSRIQLLLKFQYRSCFLFPFHMWWIAGVGWVGCRRIYLVNIQGIPMDTPNGFCLHTLSIKEFKGWQEWNLFPYFLGHNSVTETLTLFGILTAYSYSIKDFQRVTGETVCNKMRTLSLEKPVSQEYFSPKNFSSAILHFQQQSADIPADKVETSPSLHLYREEESTFRAIQQMPTAWRLFICIFACPHTCHEYHKSPLVFSDEINWMFYNLIAGSTRTLW